MRLNRRQVALRSYAEAVRLDPEHLAANPTDAGILARMAVSEVKLGRPAEARRNAGAAAKLRAHDVDCLLYTSPSPRDRTRSRMPSSA